jgi:hypothetical protein
MDFLFFAIIYHFSFASCFYYRTDVWREMCIVLNFALYLLLMSFVNYFFSVQILNGEALEININVGTAFLTTVNLCP